VNRAIERALVDRLIVLAEQAPDPQVRAIASATLRRVQSRTQTTPGTAADRAHAQLIAADVKRFLERPMEPLRPIPHPDTPPGAPIGSGGAGWLAQEEVWCSQAASRLRRFYPSLFRSPLKRQ
jgi:hypothetical protein